MTCERCKELEAACAAMRGAALVIVDILRAAEPFEETNPDWNLDAHIECTITVGEARRLVEALSSDAGRSLLTELEALRKLRDVAERAVGNSFSYDGFVTKQTEPEDLTALKVSLDEARKACDENKSI